MRKLALFSLALLPLLACTAILGDFTVGTTTGDAGDSGLPDTVVPSDGGDAGGDAAGDGGDASAPLLKCAEPANSRAQLTNIGTAAWDRVSIAPIANGQIRIIAQESNKLHAITFSPNQPSNATDTTPADQVWQLLDIERYGLPGSGGFAALVMTQQFVDGGGNQTELAVEKIPDSASAWTGIPISLPNPFATTYRLQGELVILDEANDQYFLLIYVSLDNGANYQLLAAPEKPTSLVAPLKIGSWQAVGTPANSPYDLQSPAAFFDGQNVQFLLASNGGGGGGGGDAGPPPLVQGGVNLSLTGPFLRNIPPPSKGAEFAMGMTGDSQHADLAFLIGDLMSVPTSGSLHFGSVPLPQLGSFLPENLPATAVPLTDAGGISLPDLPIDKAQFHWEPFNGVNNFFGVSRTADFLNGPLGGVNVLWADTTHGALVARQTGANKLLSDVPHIYKANITYTQQVGPTLVQFMMVFEAEQDQNGQPQPGYLWFTNINCAP